MNHEDLKEHMDRRFDKVEEKIDSYQRRVTTNETNISWIKGAMRVSAALLIAVLGSLIGAVATLWR